MDKELKQLIQTGEGYHLEFKESLGISQGDVSFDIPS